MALMKQCPACRKRCSAKAKSCKCGKSLDKVGDLDWWISYYDVDKKLCRKKIGPSRKAAEQELRRQETAKAEKRHINVSLDATTKFKTLASWYLELPEVKVKRSYGRDCQTMKQLAKYFGDKLLVKITAGMVENYRQKRLAEPSGRTPKTLVQPSSVNREVSCLRSVFSRAIRHGKAEKNPVTGLKILKENNARDRILSEEEFVRLLAHSPDHLEPLLKTAYYTGMRRGELLSLTWAAVDLREGFIHLDAKNTKTNDPRDVPLHPELIKMLKEMPRGLPKTPVFTYKGKAIKYPRRSFVTACKNANVQNFTFHDFRHTAINNWRLQGLDFFRIMACSGHRTMSTFKRYNTVSKAELKLLVSEGQKP